MFLIKISKKSLVAFSLFLYFSSKLLWDRIPLVFELLSFIIIIYSAFSFMYSYKKNISKRRTMLLIIFCFFTFYIIINAFLQDSQRQSIRALYEYIYYMIIFFSMVHVLEKSSIQNYVKLFSIWGIIISVLSWVEYTSRSYFIANISQVVNFIGGYGFRATVFSRSFLSHGVILGIFALSCMYCFLSMNRKRWLISSLFCYLSILTTSSRGPFVAFGIGLTFMYISTITENKNITRRKIYIVTILLVLIISVLVIMSTDFQTSSQMINYFLYRTRNIINWTGDAGNVGRLELWYQSIELFKSNIWFGIGPSKTGSWGVESIGVTESGVLKRLSELGLVGVSLFYFFIMKILVKGIQSYKYLADIKRNEMKYWLALFISIFINDITLQSTEEIMVSFFMWTALAGIEVLSYSTRQSQ